MRRLLLVLALLCGSCGMTTERAIWFRNPPAGWTAPGRYRHCTVRSEIVLESGRRVIRLDCPDAIVLVDTATKRRVRRDPL